MKVKRKTISQFQSFLMAVLLLAMIYSNVRGQCGSMSFGPVSYNTTQNAYEVEVFYNTSGTGVNFEFLNIEVDFDNGTVDEAKTMSATGANITATTSFSDTRVTFSSGASFSLPPGNNLIGTIFFYVSSGESTNIEFGARMSYGPGFTPLCNTGDILHTNTSYTAPTIEIKGQIINFANPAGLSNVDVKGDNITLTSPTFDVDDVTPINGKYVLPARRGNSYKVTAAIDGPNDGGSGCVNSVDLNTLSLHILGVTPLPNTAGYLAADVNESLSITTLDLIGIREVVLGLSPSQFTKNWESVPIAEYNTLPTPPLTSVPSINGEIELNNIDLNINTQIHDFYGIKGGDVDFSCLSPITTFTSPNNTQPLALLTPEVRIQKMETKSIPIYGPDFKSAHMVTMCLSVEEGLEIKGVENGALKLKKTDFRLERLTL